MVPSGCTPRLITSALAMISERKRSALMMRCSVRRRRGCNSPTGTYLKRIVSFCPRASTAERHRHRKIAPRPRLNWLWKWRNGCPGRPPRGHSFSVADLPGITEKQRLSLVPS